MLLALGLIETRGLISAIEAADAMAKAANVKLIGKEKTNPALITIRIVGEVAAVKAALDAGVSAAQRVGEVVSVHVIPRPDEQLLAIYPDLAPNYSAEEEISAPVKAKVTTKIESKEQSTKKTADIALANESVVALRKLAREENNFPIKGRDISKANKEELLKHFLTIGKK